MNWFYSENNEQRGPVSENEFDFLVRAGKITPDTLVWREGMPGWQQYREVAPPPHEGEMPPPIAGSVTQFSGDRNGPSWEQRESIGTLHAAVETVKEVLQNPSETFSKMKREGGLSSPLLYAMILGGVGSYIALVYNFFFQMLGGNSQAYNFPGAGTHLAEMKFLASGTGMAIVLGCAVLVVPVMIAFGTMVHAAIVHFCLMVLGGAKQPFETTFRVICYSLGSASILQVIPVCGGLVSGIWNLITTCIGLAKAHEISTGKAVAAVLLPLIFCCGAAIALMVFMGSFAAFAAHH